MKPLKLKPGQERRLKAGHLWIYSNEIDTAATPLKGFEPGELALATAARGHPIGTVYVNPNVLLCARLIDRGQAVVPDAAWFGERLRRALAWRERAGLLPDCRLVNGEGDALPGLIVDRYADVAVVQLNTAGMDRLKGTVIDALRQLADWRAIVLRNASAGRRLEGLEEADEILGALPPQLEILEGGCRFAVDPAAGQKTGWYYDQRDNRSRCLPWLATGSVLDAYAYTGAWGIRAAVAGAGPVVCVDSSADAVARLEQNAAANGAAVEAVVGDALATMQALAADGQRFDAVLVDPPPLVKRRKDLKAGLAHYARINAAGLAVLAPGGLLVSSSCSHHLSATELAALIQREGRRQGRELQLVARGAQSADHPVHPAIAETEYLKTLVMRAAT